MLVVEKGPGLLSTPGKTVADCLITSVTDIPEFSKARIVHRLVTPHPCPVVSMPIIGTGLLSEDKH
jgi:hypothetical protein